MRKIVAIACAGLAAASLAACQSSDSGAPATTPASTAAGVTRTQTTTATATTSTSTSATATTTATAAAGTHEEAADYTWNKADEISINLTGTSARSTADSVKVSGGTVTITRAGTYRVSGSATAGQIVVDTDDDETVRLVLDGVEITNPTGAAVAVLDAKKVVVMLADGSTNRLTDGASYVFPDAGTDEPNAALFSTADLTIAGSGTLQVSGKFNDGIASKDGLVIAGGTIVVTANDDGIRGKDYLVLKGGTVTVDAGGDGLKADNSDDAALGHVAIADANLTVTAGGDAVDAETSVTVRSGVLSLRAGGGDGASLAADASAKGLKGTVSVEIAGGRIDVDSADDAVHSNGSVTIAGGEITVATGDDAVHADTRLTVTGGTLTVSRSYEGLESAAIAIEGGDISMVSSDDGINAAGGNDGSGAAPRQPGGRPDQFGAVGNYSVAVSGGSVVVQANGDGIDANGSITMTGGTVVVQGPTANNNGAVDYDGTFLMSGGVLVAAGSAGMAQGPGTGSTQASILLRLGSVQPAGTVIHLQTADGQSVVTFKSDKVFQSLAFSSPAIVAGTTYDVYVGGSAAGSSLGGYFAGGDYTPGTKAATVTAK